MSTIAVYDESTGLMYLFDEPDAESRIDAWTEEDAESWDRAIRPTTAELDLSSLALEQLVAA